MSKPARRYAQRPPTAATMAGQDPYWRQTPSPAHLSEADPRLRGYGTGAALA